MKYLTPRVALMALAPVAFAGSITVSYSGHIVQSDIPLINLGDRFTGSFTYTRPSPGVQFPGLNAFAYGLSGRSDGLILDVNGFTFAAGSTPINNYFSLQMAVVDGELPANRDLVKVQADRLAFVGTNYPLGDLTWIDSRARLAGNPGFLQSSDLPSPFNSSGILFGNTDEWTSITLLFTQPGSPNPLTLLGFIEAVSATNETPEPRAFVLFGLGLALMFAARSHVRSWLQ